MKIKISKDDFVYYPNLEDDEFYEKIFSKKEFNKYKILKEKKEAEELCNTSEFRLLPHQNFLRNYFSIETPYNALLIFHGLGTGKTCTAISIAEQYKENVKKYKKKIIVILKKSIQKNFIKNIYDLNKENQKKRKDEIVQCTGDTYTLQEQHLTREQKLKKIRLNIKQYYQFVGYEQFANEVLRKTGWDGEESTFTDEIKAKIEKEYSNRLFVIDEIQHINIKTNTEVKKVPPILMKIVKNANNIKLVMMSATPMYDKPEEIVYLINLMLSVDRRENIKINQIFDNKGNLKEEGREILIKKCKGYISYLRGDNPLTFPVRVYPLIAKVPKIKYDINGNLLTDENKIRYLQLVQCSMSEYQYEWYNKIKKQNNDLSEEKIEKEINDMNLEEDKKNVALRNLLWVSNIIYPTKNGGIRLSKEGITDSDDGNGGLYRVSQYFERKKRIFYKYQSHTIFDKGETIESPFLDEKHVRKYSCKLYEILKNIQTAKGVIFVYSRYLPSGLIPLAIMLEQNGIQRYQTDGDRSLLEYTPNNKGGGGKRNPICYLCGNEKNSRVHSASSDDYHAFFAAKYILLTGDKNLTKVDIGKATDLINNDNNLNGQQIKIILGNEAISEGIDFKRIRQVHILEPWYNISTIEQIIGRAIRNCSHIKLKPDERNTETFLLAATKEDSQTESIDERGYRLSEIKDVKIKKVERILKETSIDCLLNKNANIFNDKIELNIITSSGNKRKIYINDEPYSRSCDYLKDCNYKCTWEPKDISKIKINTDTYNIYFAKSDIDNIKRYIKYLFKINPIYNLEDLEKNIMKIDNKIDPILFYKSLDELIRLKELLYDKFNRECYLIYKGIYYILQPKEINDENLPMYYRQYLLTTKTKTVPIKSNILDFSEKKNNIDIYDYIKKEMNQYDSFFSTIKKETKSDDIIGLKIQLSMILDRISTEILIDLLKKIINKYNSEKIDKKIDQYILEYYVENLIHNDQIFYKTIPKKIDGFILRGKYFCVKNNIWSVCNDSDRQIIDTFIKYSKKNNKTKMNDIIGIIGMKNNKISFTILDKKEFNENVSRKVQPKGRVCSSYNSDEIIKFYKSIHKDISPDKSGKDKICYLIEYILRLKDYNNPDKIYIINNNK